MLSKKGTAGTQYSTALTANVTRYGRNPYRRIHDRSSSCHRGARQRDCDDQTGAATRLDRWWHACRRRRGHGPKWILRMTSALSASATSIPTSWWCPRRGKISTAGSSGSSPAKRPSIRSILRRPSAHPDAISGVVVFGDQFWSPAATRRKCGTSLEYRSAPVLRVQGIIFDRGAWEGTAVQVKDSMIIVDNRRRGFQNPGRCETNFPAGHRRANS
jgi:hypothetical protein